MPPLGGPTLHRHASNMCTGNTPIHLHGMSTKRTLEACTFLSLSKPHHHVCLLPSRILTIHPNRRTRKKIHTCSSRPSHSMAHHKNVLAAATRKGPKAHINVNALCAPVLPTASTNTKRGYSCTTHPCLATLGFSNSLRSTVWSCRPAIDMQGYRTPPLDTYLACSCQTEWSLH